METNLIAVFHEASAGSIAETVNFPTVVGKLIGAGAESYHCDLYRHEKTFYMPDGRTHIEAERELASAEFGADRIARDFSESGMAAAIAAVQHGAITYLEFLRRIMAAGCVGYTVCITGKRALYFGRGGEVHIEKFPGSN